MGLPLRSSSQPHTVPANTKNQHKDRRVNFLNSQARIATPIRGQLLPFWPLDIRLG